MAPLKQQSSINLPAPAERPGAIVVIYDGDCQFCTAQVNRLNRWDAGKRLSFLSLHDPVVGTEYPDMSHDQLMKEMYVVSESGERYGGADAFRYLTTRLPRLWVLAPIMNFPGLLPLWSWLYRMVAKQRYRWNRDKSCEGSCHLHDRK